MKRTINFSKVDYTGNGKSDNLITIDIEYKEKDNGHKVFTASGEIWNSRHTDIYCGGQCLDELGEYLNGNPLYTEILRLWKLYHLNDMHAECEHQEALGWREKAKETRYIYEWSLNSETCSEQSRTQNALMERLTNGESVQASEREQEILALKYFYKTTTEELPQQLKRFYKDKPYKVHQEKLGFTRESEHPEGLLGKACPVCGYKYGTSWTYRPIPADDEKKIIAIINGEEV